MPLSFCVAPRRHWTYARRCTTMAMVAMLSWQSACLSALQQRPIPVLDKNGRPDTSCVVWAGDPELVAPRGSMVRITLQADGAPQPAPTTGVVVGRDATALIVLQSDSTVVRVDASRIRSIELGEPLSIRARVSRGAMIGIPIGLIGGVVAWTQMSPSWGKLAGIIGMPIWGMGLGGIAGGIVGGFTPGERWQTVWGEEADKDVLAIRRRQRTCTAWPRA